MRILVLLALAAAPATPLRPADLLQWPRMRADHFGCMLEKRFGMKLPKYTCTDPMPSTGDPCVNTTAYYAGPELPEQLAGLVQGAGTVTQLSVSWEHGEVQSLMVALKGKPKLQEIERIFGVVFPKGGKPDPQILATLNSPKGHKNILAISVQACSDDATCIDFEGFPHEGSADVDCAEEARTADAGTRH